MVPKFANPHSLSQDVEIITRSEIAERAGFTSIVHDGNHSHSLKRDLDNLLRDTWAVALAETFSSSRANKHQKTGERHIHEDGQPDRDPIAFRLVSSMKCPQQIFLHPKPPSLLVYVSTSPSDLRYFTISPASTDQESLIVRMTKYKLKHAGHVRCLPQWIWKDCGSRLFQHGRSILRLLYY